MATVEAIRRELTVEGLILRYRPQDAGVDGLPGDDLTGWSACNKSRHGEMFFGGYAGAVAFFPDQLREKPYSPPGLPTIRERVQ